MDDLDLWSLCWEVNSRFAVDLNDMPMFPTRCLKCNASLPTTVKWRSNLVSTAISSDCKHGRHGFLCGSCDEAFLLSVTKGEETCFVVDCSEILSVDKVALKERLRSDLDLVTKYLDALAANTIECNLCCYVKPRPKRPITAACQHDNTCISCIEQMVQLAIGERSLEKIKCVECSSALKGEDVRAFVSPEIYKDYGRASFMRTLNECENFRWCLSPGCGWGQLHSERESFPKVCCTRCGSETCYTHSVIWHIGQTCADYSAGTVRDAPSQEYFTKFCKRCPAKDCGVWIEKNGACPDMNCSQCKRHFCWECKVLRSSGYHYHHIKGCPVNPQAIITSPDTSSGPYRDGWDKDTGYIGHPGEYSGSYTRYRRVTVDERLS